MDKKILNQIASQMVSESKGILAMDESHGTCEKRFNALGITVNEENRRSYKSCQHIVRKRFCIQMLLLYRGN